MKDGVYYLDYLLFLFVDHCAALSFSLSVIPNICKDDRLYPPSPKSFNLFVGRTYYIFTYRVQCDSLFLSLSYLLVLSIPRPAI